MTETKAETQVEFLFVKGEQAREVDPHGHPWPDGSDVLFAVKEGKIVGRTGYIFLPHLEATWVSEEQRGGTLAYRLVKKMEDAVEEAGFPVVFAYAYDAQPEVAEYLQKVGYTRVPVSVWMKNITAVKEPK